MLKIFICEDNTEHLHNIQKHIDNYILIEDLDMEIAYVGTSPQQLLQYFDDCERKSEKVTGLYFLDIDLNCDIDGISLADKIRQHDPRGFIVFVTADAKSHLLTFEYKIEAMDYIVKGEDNFNVRIRECVKNAHSRYNSKIINALQTNFVFELSKGHTISIDTANILYFETSQDKPHNLNIYTKETKHQFRGSLKVIAKKLDKNFFRCHRSYIVNIKKITMFDSIVHQITLENGAVLDVSDKYIKELKNLMRA
ncbi:MAG: LytTR family DNA-binding domain-containing protein [Firmicutes bacterium]|nr:LytTR family DNA-binding domain-containing protein [Bacillota bacterium]